MFIHQLPKVTKDWLINNDFNCDMSIFDQNSKLDLCFPEGDYTPLEYAIYCNEVDHAKTLIEYGALNDTNPVSLFQLAFQINGPKVEMLNLLIRQECIHLTPEIMADAKEQLKEKPLDWMYSTIHHFFWSHQPVRPSNNQEALKFLEEKFSQAQLRQSSLGINL